MAVKLSETGSSTRRSSSRHPSTSPPLSLLQIQGSILLAPSLRLPIIFFSIYTFFLYILDFIFPSFLGGNGGGGGITGLLSLVVGLLISFRSNSSAERWHEGRRTWADLRGEIRNIVRTLTSDKQDVFKLLSAFPRAIKKHLRGEEGGLLEGLEDLKYFKRVNQDSSLPLNILRYMNYLDPQISGKIENLSNIFNTMERIKNTPIPLVMTIHLDQVLFLYLICIPFQLVPSLGIYSIPVEAVTAFVFLGVEGIARELSDPFGNDGNDLPLDLFCKQIEGDIDEEIQGRQWMPM